ncbi:MAG TPA: SBBP repeat-containing protein, partial [Rhizomicrobium sp.]|nr:SBBP repeat-containing protein [Rhizomicrobium sp.]
MGGFDASLLTSYFNAKASAVQSRSVGGAAVTSAVPKSTLTPPWDSNLPTPTDQALDALALGNTPYFDLSNIARTANTAGQKLDQDNQKLFALYQALNRLGQIAAMGARDGALSGQLGGLNTRFQDGLSQVQAFLSTASFNGLTLLPGAKSASVISTATVPLSKTNYVGGVVAKGAALFQPVPKLSTSDSFNITVTKGGITSDVAINLSGVDGPLTLDNIAVYINTQLSNAGFDTRIQRAVIDDGSAAAAAAAAKAAESKSTTTSSSTTNDADPLSKKTFGLQIKTTGSEKITFSAASATPSIYLAGTTGTLADANQVGRLIKLGDLDGATKTDFTVRNTPDSGTSTAEATVVDGNGNVYVVGNTTGSFGGHIEQGAQDVYLTKYDSAGTVQWTRLLGSQSSASGYSLAVDPTGGVVVAGSTTGSLSQNAVGGGVDSFVAKYSSDGTQKWLHQVDPVANDSAFAVTVDGTGNVYYGGQVNGSIGSGEVRLGGVDGYITKLTAKGTVEYRQQVGSSGTDQVSQMATTADGGLVVASVQSGRAIVTKYADGDASAAPLWQMDLGDLQSGTLGGIAVDGDKIYLSGTTANSALTAGGAANITNASSGSSDAFVFGLTDSGASAAANFVSYVGTSTSDQGGAIAVSNGHIYLTGTTRGEFAGQTQSFSKTQNMFVSDL